MLLNERQKDILNYLKKVGKITTMEYVRITKTTRRTAIRDLNDMVEKKILRIVGGKTGKQRHYTLM
jgi:ATP-dependent DNA helicase RecG